MLFIDNKYTKWYYQIIESAQNRTITGYTEKHHIIPRSLNGPDDAKNIVPLTAREHFICHMLLPKMVKSKKHRNKMIHAIWAMTTLEYSERQTRRIHNSKSYSRVRKLWSDYMSSNNPMYDPEIQNKRVQTWKANRAKRVHIPPRVLKDKFVTPYGIFKTKKSIQAELCIPEHTLNKIYRGLDDYPNNSGRGSKKITHLNLDYSKTWRENGFYILET